VLCRWKKWSSRKPQTARIDVWSAGCVFYTLLTDTLAFLDGRKNIAYGPLETLACVQRRHARIVKVHPLLPRLLEYNPRLRPTAAEALALVDAELALAAAPAAAPKPAAVEGS
jgi:serine/threonine protein kinase